MAAAAILKFGLMGITRTLLGAVPRVRTLAMAIALFALYLVITHTSVFAVFFSTHTVIYQIICRLYYDYHLQSTM